jgi:5-methylcytosine-specific restriction enzyme subunit McrC
MIPIHNVYYMLSYAWDHAQERRDLDLSGAPADTPQDLFALVLARGVLKLLRRGLDRDYVTEQRALKGVRGRIAVDETVKRALRARGEIACTYDDLSHDVLQNRIVAETMRRLLRVTALASEVREELELAAARFPRVTRLELSAGVFSTVVIHRNNRFYRFLLDICRLIHDNLLVSKDVSGGYRFHDFRRDEARMGALFEAFVRNFLAAEQDRFRVSAPTVPWAVSQADEHSLRHLPAMKSDIVLREAGHRIIIDTKFYQEPLGGQYEVNKVRSNNLYQILAYVQNAAAAFPEEQVEGMLLYAAVGAELSFDYEILGRLIRVRSIDLDQSWHRVRTEIQQKLGMASNAQGEAVA